MNRLSIIQYWHAKAPDEVEELMETWHLSADEGFDYMRFDDASAARFICEHHGRRTEEAYMTCAVPAMKADLFRICALLVHPGIYADADMRRPGRGYRKRFLTGESAPLMPLCMRFERGVLFKRESRISNSFMIVTQAGDPLLQAMLQTAVDNIERRVSNNVYLVTGPGIATQLLKNLGAEHELFRGFELWTEEMLAPYMIMVGHLPYKKSEDHWVIAQQLGSIYR